MVKLVDSEKVERAIEPNDFKSRVLNDEDFRWKFILSLALYGQFISLGWNVSQLGPSLIDLQIITGTRLDEISYVLLAFSSGFLLGVMAAPWLVQKTNGVTLIIVASGLIATFTAVTPWCQWFELMVAIFILRGVTHGVNDAACNIFILRIWGTENGPYMQGLHFCFAIGALVSPLAMSPFLNTVLPGEIMSSTNCPNGSVTFPNASNFGNVSLCNDYILNNSEIHGAFLISAGISLLSGVSCMFFICARKNRIGESRAKNRRPPQDDVKNSARILFVVVLGSAFFSIMALEKAVVFFLPTFVVDAFQWSKVHGSYAVSAFWTSFAVGRLLGIPITKRYTFRWILGVYITILLLTSTGLLLTNIFRHDIGVWVFIPCLGFCQSILFPCLMSWAEVDFFKVSGRIVSVFMLYGSVGAMVIPILLGYLMDLYSSMCFSYVLLVFGCVFAIVYLTLLLLLRVFKPAINTHEDDMCIEVEVKTDVT